MLGGLGSAHLLGVFPLLLLFPEHPRPGETEEGGSGCSPKSESTEEHGRGLTIQGFLTLDA